MMIATTASLVKAALVRAAPVRVAPVKARVKEAPLRVAVAPVVKAARVGVHEHIGKIFF